MLCFYRFWVFFHTTWRPPDEMFMCITQNLVSLFIYQRRSWGIWSQPCSLHHIIILRAPSWYSYISGMIFVIGYQLLVYQFNPFACDIIFKNQFVIVKPPKVTDGTGRGYEVVYSHLWDKCDSSAIKNINREISYVSTPETHIRWHKEALFAL